MIRASLCAACALFLSGCATYIAEHHFDSCAFEAEKSTVTIADTQLQRARRDNYTHLCMKAYGFELINPSADKGQATSYKMTRWF